MFVVVFTVALLMVAGLVVDGGYTLAAHRRAFNEAEAPARAGAQAIDMDTLRPPGTAVLDPAAARTRAEAYLAQTRHPGVVDDDADSMPVHVEVHKRLVILSV